MALLAFMRVHDGHDGLSNVLSQSVPRLADGFQVGLWCSGGCSAAVSLLIARVMCRFRS